MEDNVFDKIHEVDLRKTMETSYIDYAMSVIASRALPDVRDGLKPVQRRVLYSMIELNNGPDKPHRKCARIVGDTMGKYHPHGDSSIYGALVNMAQDWSTRYPLVDGHGNFGSVDGDGAAAMRYTEARLSKISMELLADIGKNTVDFRDNFDGTEREPAVMPARFPNLLVNGTTGIAVGMATNIPPHNLGEVIDAVVRIIDNRVEEDRDTDIDELIEVVKGPDFPTGAQILGKRGIEDAYRTGRGKIKVRAITDIEEMANGKHRIVVTELPYLVNKARLIEKVAELVKTKKIDGITAITDESSREGLRVTIELRRDVNPNVVLNQLFKHTQLQDSFGVIMLALVNDEPKVLTLSEMLYEYLKHQKEVITRRTRYELNKAEERAHILQGLLIALDHIEEVIRIIRAAANVAEAKAELIKVFGLSDAQAQAIVDMRLRALTGLERGKLEAEYEELKRRIEELKDILADEKNLLGVIRREILVIKEKYGDERRTRIGRDVKDFTDEDLIPDTECVLTLTAMGYIKRMTSEQFKNQGRGGKGIRGIQMIENDYIHDMIVTTTHKSILFFTSLGKVFCLKAYEIPESGRTSKGLAVINLLMLSQGEKITSIIPVDDEQQEGYLFMATRKGIVKKTALSEYNNIRKKGLNAIVIREDDELIGVKATDGNKEIMLITRFGRCIRFPEHNVRTTGRTSMGVIGMNYTEDNDEIVAMQLTDEGQDLLLITEKGIGKRTAVSEFPTQNRGGKGVFCYRIMEKTGFVIGALAVDEDDEVMLINTDGILIRTSCSEISVQGRNTSGVKLMDLKPGSLVSGIAKGRKKEKTEEEATEMEAVTEKEAEAETSEE